MSWAKQANANSNNAVATPTLHELVGENDSSKKGSSLPATEVATDNAWGQREQTTSASVASASAASAGPSASAAAAAAPKRVMPSSLLFDYYVVLDFEATCDNPTRLRDSEIIEFPLVIVDARTTTIINEFQRYVKPVVNPVLTAFCKELTGIQQEWVDKADTFPVVYKEVMGWLEANRIGFDESKQHKSFAIVTCGDWDLKTMLPAQLGLCSKGPNALSKSQYFARWINIKRVMQNVVPRNYRIGGMESMLEFYNLPLEGKHHSGIDDCRNIAAVLIQLLRSGKMVDYTSKSAMFDEMELPPIRRADRRVCEIEHILAPRSLAAYGSTGVSTGFGGAVAGSTAAAAANETPAAASSKSAKTAAAGAVGTAAASAASAVVDQNGFLVARDDADPVEDILAKAGEGRTMAEKERTAYSRRLASVLRHNALKMGFAITKNGFVSVDELLSHPNFKSLNLPTLATIVRENEKQRYRMVYGQDGLVYICANQGHSMPHVVPDLKEIKNAAEAPAVCVHGTYYEPWKIIQKDGLRPMNRQFVHFAKGLPGDTNVISGMRSTATVLIYLNAPLLIEDGMLLYESANGVLLSAGNSDRVILPKYFLKVVDAATGKSLL